MEIGIIGAGAASAAATYAIDQHAPDAQCTVLEKSGGVCGRAATRRRDGRYYDYRANYLKDDDERVVSLVTEELETDGLAEIDEPIHVFDEDGTVAEGRSSTERKWTYRTGITQIAKRLFEATDATVNRRTEVAGISRDGNRWRLTDADGGRWGRTTNSSVIRRLRRRPNCCATPTGTATLETRSSQPPSRSSIGLSGPPSSATSSNSRCPTTRSSTPTSATRSAGSPARCKPGHVPDGESVLIVQANDHWSVDRYDEDPAGNVAKLARLTADVVGDDRLGAGLDRPPGWRYAQPDGGVDRGALEAAERAGLYCLGDWVAGEGRLHAALRNGLETGERLARSSSGRS